MLLSNDACLGIHSDKFASKCYFILIKDDDFDDSSHFLALMQRLSWVMQDRPKFVVSIGGNTHLNNLANDDYISFPWVVLFNRQKVSRL